MLVQMMLVHIVLSGVMVRLVCVGKGMLVDMVVMLDVGGPVYDRRTRVLVGVCNSLLERVAVVWVAVVNVAIFLATLTMVRVILDRRAVVSMVMIDVVFVSMVIISVVMVVMVLVRGRVIHTVMENFFGNSSATSMMNMVTLVRMRTSQRIDIMFGWSRWFSVDIFLVRPMVHIIMTDGRVETVRSVV